jgi:hypothetical protein
MNEVRRQIEALKKMSVGQLQGEYLRVFGEDVARPVPWTQVCGEFFCVF